MRACTRASVRECGRAGVRAFACFARVRACPYIRVVRACVRASVRACVRVGVRACACFACARACVRACDACAMHYYSISLYRLQRLRSGSETV